MTVIPEPPTPTPTVHDVAAQKFLGEMQALVQNVRGYGFITRLHRRRINPTATLPTEFLYAVAVALDASEKLRSMTGYTGDQIRDAISFCNAYGPAVDEVKLKAEGLQDAVKTQRSEAGQVAFHVYRVARSAKNALEKEEIFPHLETMKRALGRGRKKAVKTKPETEPAVEPAKKA